VTREVLRFALAGVAGLLIDSLAMYSFLGLGFAPIAARLCSFSFAVVSTWLINRTFTFQPKIGQSITHEFLAYVTAMAFGACVNLSVSLAILSSTIGSYSWSPLAALAGGSISAMFVNFLAAKHYVFKKNKT
jgi:putative flippase GtrA